MINSFPNVRTSGFILFPIMGARDLGWSSDFIVININISSNASRSRFLPLFLVYFRWKMNFSYYIWNKELSYFKYCMLGSSWGRDKIWDISITVDLHFFQRFKFIDSKYTRPEGIITSSNLLYCISQAITFQITSAELDNLHLNKDHWLILVFQEI